MFFSTLDIHEKAKLHFSKGLSTSLIKSEPKKDGVDPVPGWLTIIRRCQRFRSGDKFQEKWPKPCRPLSAIEERHVAKVKAVMEMDV